jgi:hypothetical protein
MVLRDSCRGAAARPRWPPHGCGTFANARRSRRCARFQEGVQEYSARQIGSLARQKTTAFLRTGAQRGALEERLTAEPELSHNGLSTECALRAPACMTLTADAAEPAVDTLPRTTVTTACSCHVSQLSREQRRSTAAIACHLGLRDEPRRDSIDGRAATATTFTSASDMSTGYARAHHTRSSCYHIVAPELRRSTHCGD